MGARLRRVRQQAVLGDPGRRRRARRGRHVGRRATGGAPLGAAAPRGGGGTMSAAVLGGHLAHLIVFGGFGLAGAVVLVWPVPFDEEADGPAAADRLRPSADRAGLQAACIGLFAAAAVHVAVMPDHFRESWLYGCFFLVAAATQVAVGTVVLVRP